MAILAQREFESRLGRTENLIAALEAIPDEDSRRSALDAVQALLDLHGDGLARMMALIDEAGEPSQPLMAALGRDQMVGGLLLLHGVHPLSLDARVAQALERVRPYLASHGGNVQLLGTDDGVVSLRLEGSCHGCASSTMTLKYAIEREIMEGAPDVVAIEVEGVAEPAKPPPGFVPLSGIKPVSRAAADATDGWRTLSNLPQLEPGQLHLAEVDGGRVLLCRLEGAWYAYRARCPKCGEGNFSVLDEELRCAGCDHGYDARHAGRSFQVEGLHLDPLPLLVEAGEVRIATGI